MKIKITIVDQKGNCPCHRGHKVGDIFDFDTERGKLCPMAAHVLFPMIAEFSNVLFFGSTAADAAVTSRPCGPQ